MAAAHSPWLSVVMPVHDGARDLPATLESAAAERPQGVEFLLYDSSADAACREIAERFAGRLDIRYLALPEMPSWPGKTNLAVEHAAAPHIAMLHQDDVWLPGHIAAVQASIAAAPEAAIHVGPSRLIDEAGRDIGPWSIPFAGGTHEGEHFLRSLLIQNFIAIPSPVIRRDIWRAVRGMDEALWYTGDWDLYLKLAKAGRVAVRTKPTTAFRLHASSLTMKGSANLEDFREQMELVLRRHEARTVLDEDAGLMRRARASIDINCGLAEAAAGHWGGMSSVLKTLLCLGPRHGLGYIHASRIVDRVLPRLKLKMKGTL